MTMQTVQDVIVVGAGLAGLICARRLHQAGHQVCVLEKSRGLGGRLATRRFQGVPLDHGVRYLAHPSDRLQQLIEHWRDQQILVPWQPHSYKMDAAGSLHAGPHGAPYWVAPAGMNAIGKQLAQGLTIHRQQRLVSLALTAQDTWQLTVELATDQSHVRYQARAIILAFPAPQIIPVLQPLAAIAPIQPLLAALKSVTYDPVITVMAQYDDPTRQPTDALPGDPTAPWLVEAHPATPLFWAGLDSSKRSTPAVHVVTHSSAAFARQWLDEPDLQSVGQTLLTQASNLIATWLGQPQTYQVHRWRYGLVNTPVTAPLLTTATPLPLAACGDWCGAANLDTALASGWATAAAIHTAVGGATLPAFPVSLIPDGPPMDDS